MNWSAWGVEVTTTDGKEAHVLVTADAPESEPRSPVMINLVLDRSGSMKGAPLSAAVEAALQFIELSRPDDYLGLLLFDGVPEQRVPVVSMDARGKRQMTEALTGIQTGRGTALYQAVEMGAKALQRTLIPGRRPRLLLLTDGEPSVGHESVESFDGLGRRMAQEGMSVHALGLARHYVAEILEALTSPSGNAFEHVDGPEGLSEAMGGLAAHLLGQVATDAEARVQPDGFAALTCRHAFPTRVDSDSLVVTLGDISRGLPRRVLFSGNVNKPDWSAVLHGSSKEHGDTTHRRVELERVTADSPRGRQIIGIAHELELVAAESAAWLALARKDLERAEAELETAESRLRSLMAQQPEGVPSRRHVERLADLRLAVERGEGDIPLLIRRARSARAGTSVSQVIPLQIYRQRPQG